MGTSGNMMELLGIELMFLPTQAIRKVISISMLEIPDTSRKIESASEMIPSNKGPKK